METTGAETEIGDISDSGNENGETFFKKPGRHWVRVRLFVRTTGEDIGYFRFSSRPES